MPISLICSFFSALALLYPNLLWASSSNYFEFINKAPCAEHASKKIDPKLAKQTWVPKAVSIPGEPLHYGISFRDTRTKKAYRLWTADNELFFSLETMSNGRQTLSFWNGNKACELSVQYSDLENSIPNSLGFTDDDLHKTLKNHPWGILYVWSPYMPLSVAGIQDIKEAVQKKGGALTVLMDGQANHEEAEKWAEIGKVSQDQLTPVASIELYEREVTLHYPIAFLYKDNFLSNRTYVGHKTSEAYQEWIGNELAELKRDMN